MRSPFILYKIEFCMFINTIFWIVVKNHKKSAKYSKIYVYFYQEIWYYREYRRGSVP